VDESSAPRPPCVAERFLLPPSSRSSARATRSPPAHGQHRDALGRGWPAAARAWRVPRCPGACARKDRSPPPVPRWRTRSRGMCVKHGLNSGLCPHTRCAAVAAAAHGKQPRRRRTRRTRWHRACRSEAHQGNFPPVLEYGTTLAFARARLLYVWVHGWGVNVRAWPIHGSWRHVLAQSCTPLHLLCLPYGLLDPSKQPKKKPAADGGGGGGASERGGQARQSAKLTGDMSRAVGEGSRKSGPTVSFPADLDAQLFAGAHVPPPPPLPPHIHTHCMYVHVHASMYVYASMYMYMYMCTCIHVHVHGCIHVHYVYMCKCIHVHVHGCIKLVMHVCAWRLWVIIYVHGSFWR
jgi:hypothetical protein